MGEVATSIYLLLIAAGLLVALPQIVAYGVGAMAMRRGSWWPVILAIVVAPAVFYLVASQLYQPEGVSLLQRMPEGRTPLAVSEIQTWSLGHGVAAAVIQVVRLWRG